MIQRRLLLLTTCVTILCISVVAAARERVIPSGHEREFIELVAPYELPGPIVADRVLANIEIHPSYVDFEITRGDVHGPRLALLRMDVDSAVPGAFRYSSTPAPSALDPVTRDAVARLKSAVSQHATPEFALGVLADPATLVSTQVHDEPLGPLLWFLVVALGVAMALGFSVRRAPTARRESVVAFALVCAATLGAVAALGWFVSSRGQVLQRWVADWGNATARDRAVAVLTLTVTLGAVAALADLAVLRWQRKERDTDRPRSAVFEVLGVLAWSAVVRFGFTQANILTDGGSGYRRLLEFIGGYGGLSILVDLFAPSHMMWTAIRVPIVLAALAPPVLTVLARELGFRRPIPLLAGLMLASLPLHAAMFTSDFLMGPLLTLTLTGLTLAAYGACTDQDLPVFAGACLLAFGTWCRPDAAVAGAPLLAVAWPAVREWRRRPLAWLGFGFFGANMIAAQIAIAALGGPAQRIAFHLPLPDDLRLALVFEDVPYWLSLGAVLGVAFFKRVPPKLLAVIAVAVVSGLLPLSIRGAGDRTASYMEAFRYGTWALPWLVLVAASGCAEGARALAARFGDPAGGGRAQRVYIAALIGVAGVVLSSPIRARRYLSRAYGPLAEERVFRKALARVPRECTLVVPDDITELLHRDLGTIEIQTRYNAIASEQATAKGRPAVDILGVTAFLYALDHHGWPRKASGGAPLCYWFFEGSYCYTGAAGVPPESCRQLLDKLHSRPILDEEIDYVSHRFVTRPDLHTPPLYDAHQHLRLLELMAPHD